MINYEWLYHEQKIITEEYQKLTDDYREILMEFMELKENQLNWNQKYRRLELEKDVLKDILLENKINPSLDELIYRMNRKVLSENE